MKLLKQLKEAWVQIANGHITELSAVSEQTSASSEEVECSMEKISKGTHDQANDLEASNHRVEK